MQEAPSDFDKRVGYRKHNDPTELFCANTKYFQHVCYMFTCERCARKIYTCYTEDTKMVHTHHSPKSNMASGNTCCS